MTNREAEKKSGRPLRGALRKWLCCSTALCGVALSALSPALAEAINGTDETVNGSAADGTKSSPWTISGEQFGRRQNETATLTIEVGGSGQQY